MRKDWFSLALALLFTAGLGLAAPGCSSAKQSPPTAAKTTTTKKSKSASKASKTSASKSSNKASKGKQPAKGPAKQSAKKPSNPPAKQPAAKKPEPRSLPKVIDLGATKCIPCKMMAPILEELKKEHRGSLEVVFIDVWENRDAADKYGIQSIPTQIFYDAKGKEFARHVGFFPKEDILKTFEKQGIKLVKPSRPKKEEKQK